METILKMVNYKRLFIGFCFRPRHLSPKILFYTIISVLVFVLYVLNDSNFEFSKTKTSMGKINTVKLERFDEIDAKSPESEDDHLNHRNLNSFYDKYNVPNNQVLENKDDMSKYGSLDTNNYNQERRKDTGNLYMHKFVDNKEAFNRVIGNGYGGSFGNNKGGKVIKRYNKEQSQSYRGGGGDAADMRPLVLKHRDNFIRENRKRIKSYGKTANEIIETYNNNNNNNFDNLYNQRRSPKKSYQNYILENYQPQRGKENGGVEGDDELMNVYIVKKFSHKTTTHSTTTTRRSTTTDTPSVVAKRKKLSAKDKRKDIRKCNKVRMQRLKNRCKDLAVESLERRNDSEIIKLAKKIITDDKHRVLINALPKTGCSSWKMVMLNNSGLNIDKPGQYPSGGINNWEVLNSYGLRDLSEFPIEHIRYRLRYYYSILTVRHPFERLESTFREKFTKSNKFYKDKLSAKIISMYRKNNNNNNDGGDDDYDYDRVTGNQNVTFEEFVRYTLDANNTDRHWMPFWDLANPCILPYQYIAKTETASRDMDYIAATKLSYGVSGGAYRYNPTQTEEQVQIHSSKILPLFSQLSPEIQEDLLLQTLEKYMDDMELFGYRIRKHGRNIIADCEMYSPEGMCC